MLVPGIDPCEKAGSDHKPVEIRVQTVATESESGLHNRANDQCYSNVLADHECGFLI